MDCASFILIIKSDDLIKELVKLRERKDVFDIGNIDKKHPLYSSIKKKVVGKYKIETPDAVTLNEFVTSPAKTHSFTCDKLEKKMEEAIGEWEKEEEKTSRYQKL